MTPPVQSFVAAYQHGIYPRSEAVVQATRDLERGRTDPAAVDEAFRSDREAFLALQRRAGLDYLSDGLLRWQDLFRPLVDGTPTLEARVLVRWFDNNSFFRAPEGAETPRLSELPAWVLEDGIPEPRVGSLPSPYLFSRVALARADRDDLMAGVARDVLAPAARRMSDAGFGLIHLEEPWLAYAGIDDAAWDRFEEAVGAVREAATGATVVLHTYYGDVAPHADRLRRLPVDAVGVDFVETDLEALPTPWETGLVAGCLDGRSSVLEDAAAVAAFVRRAVDRLEPTSLYLTSGSDLELAGPEVAPRKVEVLGEVAREVRGETA
jgi:5-methyltetrahydropteroyltriglutamate--homocysteine methyltransferase